MKIKKFVVTRVNKIMFAIICVTVEPDKLAELVSQYDLGPFDSAEEASQAAKNLALFEIDNDLSED